MIGYDADATTWYYGVPGSPGFAGTGEIYAPINFTGPSACFGSFRDLGVRAINQYLSGRYYDPVLYAPKDSVVLAKVEPLFEHPSEFPGNHPEHGAIKRSSYCLSPAAMYNPTVLSRPVKGALWYRDPFAEDHVTSFRSPAMSQARYSNLKTHILEHNWLQNRTKLCNPRMQPAPGTWDCEPYYFNGSNTSAPATLFFDGHIDSVGVMEAYMSDARAKQQVHQAGDDTYPGLWNRHTPLGSHGYYLNIAKTITRPSCFHILTTEGILGRDVIR
jgi:hypothetical protein